MRDLKYGEEPVGKTGLDMRLSHRICRRSESLPKVFQSPVADALQMMVILTYFNHFKNVQSHKKKTSVNITLDKNQYKFLRDF